MKQRAITAIIALAALLIVLFVLPPVAVKVIIAAVMLVGAWEWSGFFKAPALPLRLAYVAIIAALLWAVTDTLAAYAEQVLIISMLWWIAALLWTFFFPTQIPTAVRWLAGAIVLVPMYVALIMLYDIDRWMLLFALLIVWSADSGAFFAGKRFGRVKLAPAISPGKTWEGVIGGLVAVVLLTIARALLTATDLAVWVPFCLAVAVVSIVGDLTVSMFKRTAGVKDSGALFPGHGGVLDRVDSIAAAAPLFALGTSWAGLR
ncbi:MAG: phosphatidate cytidylyltransferase [Gammaproteobacteria bacterium]|nr:phosphatidate cytidylyltransferase [Gammaproteobacteria bacterium]